MKTRKYMYLVLVLISVGFAAVSTTLLIDWVTSISSNSDDFNVYFSDVLVNGVQDLSIVESSTKLSFITELSKLGDKYILDYDVTNGSKNYDTEITITCVGANDYLTLTNEFNTDDVLPSLQTRSGKLTVELIKPYAGEGLEQVVECTLIASAVERETLGEGQVNPPLEVAWLYTDSDASGDISVGDIYSWKKEKFNVVSQTDDKVTLLAQNNIGIDYKQTTSNNFMSFSNVNGWEYAPGPKEIYIQDFEGNAKTYINEYVAYLESETGSIISGDLISLSELKNLGCITTDDYSWQTGLTCAVSPHANWLVNGQHWWTRSARVNEGNVWYVNANGILYGIENTSSGGIRPIITISKSDL